MDWEAKSEEPVEAARLWPIDKAKVRLFRGVAVGRLDKHTLTTEGAVVKRSWMLGALAAAAGLTGCQSCWPDRADIRPSKESSIRDWLDYQGTCGGVGPDYHYGAADGWRDRRSARKSAITNADIALDEQFAGGTSRDFRYGFQQAFIDIANGGNGALPAIPPSRYWSAPYRTCWGHNKAREWFEGYEAGAGSAKCGALCSTGSVPTSAQRGPDHQITIGLGSGNCDVSSVAPANGLIQATPLGGFNPYSRAPYSGVMNSPPSMNPPLQPSPMMSPATPLSLPSMPAFRQPEVPMYPLPTATPVAPLPPTFVPVAPATSLPLAPNSAADPHAVPSSLNNSGGHSISPLAPTTQQSLPASNPGNRFAEQQPSGFRSEGARR